VKLRNLANEIRSVVGLAGDEGPAQERERRLDQRLDFTGHRVVLKERRTVGILHLKDMSKKGACGISDMPLAVGSVVFVELRKPHFRAAEVRWVRNVMIGLQFYHPLKAEQLERMIEAHLAAKREREAAEPFTASAA
jgi:PilZ domain